MEVSQHVNVNATTIGSVIVFFSLLFSMIYYSDKVLVTKLLDGI